MLNTKTPGVHVREISANTIGFMLDEADTDIHEVKPAFPVGKGIIIPAYLALTDITNWTILQEGAALMASKNSNTYQDYWIVVNGPQNGPFDTPEQWTQARQLWNPIRENKGRIFGYVHTVQSADLTKPEAQLYRSLSILKAEISAWIEGYPELDGIWLDEFYPRYEIAPTQPKATYQYPQDYPNGEALAPTDKGFINSAGQFNGAQVNPTGGFYSQLTSWIRSTYPQLRIIGNAGGDLYSNQYLYGDLVDVLVSFEQTFADAQAIRGNGINLDRLNRVTKAAGQLALIHNNNTDLIRAIDMAFTRDYTHVYTTDRQLNNNLWGGISSYLTTELQYIFSKP